MRTQRRPTPVSPIEVKWKIHEMCVKTQKAKIKMYLQWKWYKESQRCYDKISNFRSGATSVSVQPFPQFWTVNTQGVAMCQKDTVWSEVKVTQLCLTHCDPMGIVHGIVQTRILEWVTFSFSRGPFQTQGSNPSLPLCRQMLYQLSHKGSPRILE